MIPEERTDQSSHKVDIVFFLLSFLGVQIPGRASGQGIYNSSGLKVPGTPAAITHFYFPFKPDGELKAGTVS